eukprot:COSAG01_NODE_19401_length_1011_cov_2.995614_3_plen_26_part_01
MGVDLACLTGSMSRRLCLLPGKSERS